MNISRTVAPFLTIPASYTSELTQVMAYDTWHMLHATLSANNKCDKVTFSHVLFTRARALYQMNNDTA